MASSTTKCLYQVFFSFPVNDDSVTSFISTLNVQLGISGILTFLNHHNHVNDQNEHDTWHSHLQAIEASRISIILFTKSYGGSSRCMKEVEKIMECHRASGQVVLPVFYGVEIGEVRKQGGEFGEAFEGLVKGASGEVEDSSQVSWRRAVADAASFSGWEIDASILSETKVIGNIVDSVHIILDSKYLSLPCPPVGIDICAQDVLQCLSYNHKEVHMVGVWGTGGIGKTTIAKAIYNRLNHSFEGSSFLANINDSWKQDNGKDFLEKQLLAGVINASNMMINENSTETEKIRTHRRVLVVLDDVSQVDQVTTLCGSKILTHEWFAPGSIILITTRDKHVLDLLNLNHVCEMKKMDTTDALELFSWHAFRQFSPFEDLIKLARKAVAYCGGLPLALEVLGSVFLDKTMSQWDSVLELFEGNQSKELMNILKLSYDFLDDSEKAIFLEIACFYIGKDRHNITQLLNGSGLAAETGISNLINRSLLKVDKNNKLEMHGLLQELGREINHYKPKTKWIHNVFLSFRGEDTRKSFTSHLYAAFQSAGIEVYMDDKLERGENISSSLLQAIEGARISIIIFSINYANSRWCLEEAEKIMECHRTIGQEVLPVFYGVEPSEVRKQIGTFGKAFEGLVQRISVKNDTLFSWKRALTEAANLSGWNLNNYRTETELIGDILTTVTTKLDDGAYLFVADHPVGVQSHVHAMTQLLSGSSNEVLIVGILGMGGSGKTTIAKAIYNEINKNFEGRSFLANIREIWGQDNGQVNLQEQLLSGVMKTRRVKLLNIELGKTIVKESLCSKRALVVLDDIHNLDQLNALCGSRDWFGRGSRIIITTRDEHLLNILQVDNIYRMKEMEENESLELFSWHAFKQATPTPDFVELSRRVVEYSGRLPLALEVLGSYLFDRAMTEWESALLKLEIIPNDQIQKKLKLSFDGLRDDMEKDIFLDICCFFIGKDRNYVTQILDGCGLHAEIGITVLIERNLVKVDKNNKLAMHDLLRVMGREIIREKSPEKPEKRSRLWFHDDVVDVLTNNTATIAVKGLTFSLPKNNGVLYDTKAFKKMKRLRLLQLGHVKLAGDYEYLSKDLRWLSWHGFPLRYMPENFNQKSLVAIDLKYSNLQLVWKEPELLDKLKILNLSHSHYLIQTPDFSRLPNLEKLMLKDCPRLLTVHSTIGDLKYLILVNLKDCKSLSHLPRSIYKLKSLKSLVLSGCSKIDKLEEDIMQMESLTSLVADNTAITQVPHSLVKSKSIKYVSLCGFEGLSRDVFPSLILSWMSPKNNPMSHIKVFQSISSSLQILSHGLSSKSCSDLESRPATSQISYTESPMLIDLPNSNAVPENFTCSLIIQAGEHSKATDTLIESISQGWTNNGSGECSFPDSNNPNFQTFKGKGSSVLFKVPNFGSKLKGMALCIIYSSSLHNLASECDLLSVLMINYTKTTVHPFKRDRITSFKDEEWQGLMSSLEPGDEVEVVIVLGHRFTVKNTAVHLIYGELTDDKIAECSSPQL
ncbi:hypothetical protein RIF29_15030 [Crotalaria pallida]|uniref:TIR domain-containing protein n=1 Tax=Crotalaria pallida TaxID=3830 RepID=A0AAN9FCS6_CROPI